MALRRHCAAPRLWRLYVLPFQAHVAGLGPAFSNTTPSVPFMSTCSGMPLPGWMNMHTPLLSVDLASSLTLPASRAQYKPINPASTRPNCKPQLHANEESARLPITSRLQTRISKMLLVLACCALHTKEPALYARFYYYSYYCLHSEIWGTVRGSPNPDAARL